MMYVTRLCVLACLLGINFYRPILCAPDLRGRKVVLMSMDGFRYDYLTKTTTPHFDSLKAKGASVPYVNNTFATITFPSHYTIATGLYEENHGIVGNKMYDPKFDSYFNFSTHESRWWDEAEPIWINAVKSGIKVGTFFWPGSEVELQNLRPTEWKVYNGSVPYKTRVDTLIDEWLGKRDFEFGIIYFDEPDHSGHKYGPESPHMLPVIQRMDSILGYFFEKLEANNLKDRVDVIVTSDHGMTSVDNDTIIYLRDYVNETLLLEVVSQGPVTHLRPQPGKAKELAQALSGIKHAKVYLKEDIPDHFNYKHNRRIMDVVIIADEGWQVKKEPTSWSLKGNHGYSNEYMSMKPIFMATGPSFKEGFVKDPIKNEDIYPLLCHLLDLKPAPHNGSFERVKDFLKPGGPPDFTGTSSQTRPSSIFTIFFLLLVIYSMQRAN